MRTKYQKSRKNAYFSFIHSYFNYGNIAWGNTYKTKLKKIFTYQKKTARVIFFGDTLAHYKQLMLNMNVFNFYQINIYQNLTLLYEAHTGTTPLIFFNLIGFQRSIINPKSSKNSGGYRIFKSARKLTNFAISRRVRILGNTVLDAALKNRIFTTIQSKSQRSAFHT